MISRADLSTIWLLGDPVSHSMSPLIQNTAIQALGARSVYLAARVEADNFAQVVSALPKMGALGANVTVPHKVRAFELCDALSPSARAMGAVNTLQFRDQGVYGHNTDGLGWWSSLSKARARHRLERALVLGAGGASRAVCHTLLSHGIEELVVLNRSVEKCETLVAELAASYPGANLRSGPLCDFSEALGENTLIVQTTSVGLKGEASPVEVPQNLPSELLFSELIYGRVTPLMRAFQQRGVAYGPGCSTRPPDILRRNCGVYHDTISDDRST